MLSVRTKAALAARKRRGVKPGAYRGAKLTAKARQAGVKAIQARIDAWVAGLAPIIRELQATGVTSLGGIAAAFNERSIPTATGRGTWQATQVRRVLVRTGAGVKAIQARIDARVAGLAPIIRKLQTTGVTSLAGIAAALNERGIPTATGRGAWRAVQVRRVLVRIGKLVRRLKGRRKRRPLRRTDCHKIAARRINKRRPRVRGRRNEKPRRARPGEGGVSQGLGSGRMDIPPTQKAASCGVSVRKGAGHLEQLGHILHCRCPIGESPHGLPTP
jgi:hypothetical protein